MQTTDIGIDVGNSKFSVCVRGEGIVASESSYLAYKGDILSESSVVAFGDEAKSMHEKSPPGISVVTPMHAGVVMDCRAAGILLKRLTKKAGIRFRLAKPKVLVGALFGSSDIERKAFSDVANSLGYCVPYVVPEPLAAVISIPTLNISDPYAHMIIDVGDGATEAIVTSLGQTIMGSSARFGGASIDHLLIEHIRKNFGLTISQSQARKIKEDLSWQCRRGYYRAMISVKGIGAKSFIPCEKQVPAASILSVLDKFSDDVARFVLKFLQDVPPEVAVDLIENGIHLCGGASQTAFVREKIAKATNLSVNFVEKPEQTVISGLYRMLDYAKHYS